MYFRLYQGEKAFGFDKGKIIISTKNTPFSGADLAECLRGKYQIEIEMEAATYVIAMTSLMDDKEGFVRLKQALLSIEEGFRTESGVGKGNLNSELDSKGFKIPKAKRRCSVKKALKMPEEVVSLKECKGRISKDYVFVYPPGIPVLTPGDGISKEIRDLLLKYIDLGLNVKGVYDDKKIKVLTEGLENG